MHGPATLVRGASILLIEDDVAIATVIRVAIESEGALLDVVTTLAARDIKLAGNRYDALITDVMLPDGNGLDGLSAIFGAGNQLTPVIVLSAQNTLDTAVRAESEGAFDYLPKPFDLDELVAAIRSAIKRDANSPAHDGGARQTEIAIGTDAVPIIGRDTAMQLVYRTLARVAPTDLSVLILGESGTGKELVAQAIHSSSSRKGAPFVAVNMAAIPRELIESELFGHEKGAFTGAHARSTGRFEQAARGTLFLDEIGDMPIEAQTRLLRVLQSGEYSPIGSAQLKRANVRILAATNQDLQSLVALGRFREDLYYRLNVIPIHLPPLRSRRSDIALLARYFLEQGAVRGLPIMRITTDAVAMLTSYDWPGNVRELSNAMQRLALLTRGYEITRTDVARLLTEFSSAAPAPQILHQVPAVEQLQAAVRQWFMSDDAKTAIQLERLFDATISIIERELIESVLEQTAGNQLRAAQQLGINRNTLRLKRGAQSDTCTSNLR